MLDNAHMVPLAIGIILAAAGVAGGTAGGHLIHKGQKRVIRWLPAGALERATVKELGPHHLDHLDDAPARDSRQPGTASATSVGIAPVITRDGGGFGLSLTF